MTHARAGAVAQTMVVCLIVGVMGLAVPRASATSSGTSCTPVARDPAGDWGSNAAPTLGSVGNTLGADLVSACIAMPDKRTIDFEIGVHQLSSAHATSIPTGYVWHFTVARQLVELVSCELDDTTPACLQMDSKQTQSAALFALLLTDPVRGKTAALDVVLATFDPTHNSITIPVPISAFPFGIYGSKIVGSRRVGGFAIGSYTGALVESNDASAPEYRVPNDTMNTSRAFLIGPRR